MAGAPVGNDNARKGKKWEQAIKRALARTSGESVDAGLDALAEKLVSAAQAGDQWALLEIGNRMDGKPRQQLDVEANVRSGDISDKPLGADEWAERYGDNLAASARSTESTR